MNDTTSWIKATKSNGTGDCVEMRGNSGSIEIRDSKNPVGSLLRVAPGHFRAWVEAAKNGEFDSLA